MTEQERHSITEAQLQQYLLREFPKENEECEWKEFKSLKHSFKGDEGKDVLSYVSALANMNGGYLVIGVVDKTLEVVGTDTYNYDLEKARLRLLVQCANLPSEGLKVEDYITSDTNKTVWVIYVPRHMNRLPVYAHSKAWMRVDDSLIEITKSRLQRILDEREDPYDWSAEVVEGASLKDLDQEAIKVAREGYKQRYPQLTKDADAWPDSVFLDKAYLTIGGKITRTTLLLVGKPESAFRLNHMAQIVWKCFQDGQIFGDIYTIPFVLTTSELLGRIRNYRFKIYPKNSLIPAEVWKYDTESILEGMHNAIAHQNYEKNARILVTEDSEKLLFQNDGYFMEGDYKKYITGEKTPKVYRNPALVKAMVNIKMIDSQGYGIHKMFMSQKQRFLPMPDYERSTDTEVILCLPGSVIDENYSLLLLADQSLNLTDAVLLDRVQKGLEIPDNAAAMLRKRGLIEGRKPNIYVSKKIAHATQQKVEYTKHKGLDSKQCDALLLDALKDHGSLTKQEVVALLWSVLSDQLDDNQKNVKIDNILRKLKKNRKIINDSRGSRSSWMLVES